MEQNFAKSADFGDYWSDLHTKHQLRIRKHLELQSMWEMPVRQTQTGRTVYVNNEPWTATRLTVALLAAGAPNFKAFMPPDDRDSRERSRALAELERFFKACFKHTDMELFKRRQGRFINQWGYSAAVYGWHGGICLVQDAAQDWPVFTDVWTPVDTFPDMDGTGIVHRQSMTKYMIESKFGPKRPGGKVDGYAFSPPENTKNSKLFEVHEYIDEGTACAFVRVGADWQTIKKQMEHELGCNPAWCNPCDAPPFKASSINEFGTTVSMPNNNDNRWLEWYGQSPMMGYLGVYRYMSEVANQIADVVERWASPIVIAKTQDGHYVEIDLTAGDQNTVPLDTVVDIITPPKFPTDDRAWLQFLVSDIEKASYPRAAYGAVGSTEAAMTIQLLKQASGYIIDPLVKELEFTYEMMANNIIKQLSAANRAKQYSGRKFAVRSQTKAKKQTVEYCDVSTLPLDATVTVELKGAGVPADELQTLMAVTNAANANNQVLSNETLLDQFTTTEDPQGEETRIFWQKMRSHPKVLEMAAPVTTLLDVSDEYRRKGGDLNVQLADMMYAMAFKSMQELAAQLTPNVNVGASGGMPGGAAPAPAGMPMDASGSMGGVDGSAQMMGSAPIGAPPPGSTMPPTGPDPTRGMLMANAAAGPPQV